MGAIHLELLMQFHWQAAANMPVLRHMALNILRRLGWRKPRDIIAL